MTRVLLFGGTTEGRILAKEYSKYRDIELYVSVATDYGRGLLSDIENMCNIHVGRMDENDILAYIKENGIDYCVDATHPYAVEVSKNIKNACYDTFAKYYRVVRDTGNVRSCSENVIEFDSILSAVDYLCKKTGNILITTGSKELDIYCKIPDFSEKCYVRVLPTPEAYDICARSGFKQSHIIGMQGPFSTSLNIALIKEHNCRYVVSKLSGVAGGFMEKVEAAAVSGATLILINPPQNEKLNHDNDENVISLNDAILWAKKNFGESLTSSKYLNLVGIGPGSISNMTQEAIEAICDSDMLIGAQRMLDAAAAVIKQKNAGEINCKFYKCYDKNQILTYIKDNNACDNISILFSGDISFSSNAFFFYENNELKDYNIKLIPGLSSVQYLFDKCGLKYEDSMFISSHGRDNLVSGIVDRVKSGVNSGILLQDIMQLKGLCSSLALLEDNSIEIIIGSDLSYENEAIRRYKPNELIDLISLGDFELQKLSVVLIHKKNRAKACNMRIKDSLFIRNTEKIDSAYGKKTEETGKIVPMTKEEVRTLAVSKLDLRSDSIICDLGCGTGSVSVLCAMNAPDGRVYSFDTNEEACILTQKNAEKFGLDNIEVACMDGILGIEGLICNQNIDNITHIFVGGIGGRIKELIDALKKAGLAEPRIVFTAVTLETLGDVNKLLEAYPEYEESLEIVQVAVSRSKKAGHSHMLLNENSVYIISLGGGNVK